MIAATAKLVSRLRRAWASDIGQRLAVAVTWGGASVILGRGLPILAMMLTARILGVADFGRLALLSSTALAFEALVSAGLSITATKFVAEFASTSPARAGRIIDLANTGSLMMSLVVGLSVWFASPWLSVNVLHAPELSSLLAASAVLIAILASAGLQQGIILGLEAFRAGALVELVFGLTAVAAVPLGGYLYGLPGAFGGYVAAQVVRLVGLHMVVTSETARRGIIRRWRTPLDELAVLWRFSLPAFLNSLLTAPIMWIAIAVIAREPRGAEHVGVFNAANQWFSLLLFLPTTLNSVAFPVLAEVAASGAVGKARNLFQLKLVGTLLIGTFCSLIVALLAPQLMALYGPSFAGSHPVLITIAVAAWFAAPLTPIGNIFVAHNRAWAWLMTGIIWAGVLLAAVYVFASDGAGGLALAIASAYACRLAVTVAILYATGDLGAPEG